jgi:hypothetical protein
VSATAASETDAASTATPADDDEPDSEAVAAAAVAGATASNSAADEEPDVAPDDTPDTDTSIPDDTEDAPPDTSQVIAAAATTAVVAASDSETAPASGESPAEQPHAAPPPPQPFGPDDTGEFAFDAWTVPTEEEQGGRGTVWLVLAGVAAAVIAVVAFFVLGANDSSSTTTIGAVETTITSVTTTSASSTTSTGAPTTTVIAFPLPGDWPAKGEPIAAADLTLKQSAIGPIDTGTPIADVAGRLTASLGEATASGIDGLCPPDESYWLQFGQLTAIFDGFDPSSVFVSYRYDEPQGTDPDLGLQTLSGIAIGDTVEDLINTYTQFTISFEIIDSKDFFRLSDGGDLLLWGPISSADPAGLIEGIYSPTICDTTP